MNWVVGSFYQHNWQNFIQEVQDTFLPDLFKTATGGDFNDSLWSYEIGGKSRSQDGRFAVDGSVYVIKWKNIQFNYVLPTCNFPFTTNAGDATSKGVDLTVRARPTDSLDVGLEFGYVHASYDNTLYFGGRKLFATEASITGEGDRLRVAPWTASMFTQWRFVAVQHDAYFRVNFNHSAGLNHGLASQDINNGSYDPTTIGLPTLNDLDLKVGTYLGALEAAVFVNNATNEHPILTHSHAAPGDPLFMSSTVRPRTVGINASYRF